MKNLKLFFLSILILSGLNVFAQDTSAVHQISNLTLDRYVETPTYIINKNYVVYEYEKIRKIIYADIPSFKVDQQFWREGAGFALDKNGIYFQGTLFRIDTVGFKIVGYKNNDDVPYNVNEVLPPKEWLWKNKDTVYKNNTALTGIDASSFEAVNFVNGPYFKDKNTLFYYDKKIEQSNLAPVNISFFNSAYYDESSIYVAGKAFYTKDGEMLLPVNSDIIKTKKYAYRITNLYPLQKVIKKTMDAASLKGLSPNYSIDKYHVYCDTTALPITPKNFKNIKIWEQVNSAYISDGIHVYNGTILQADLDGKSFGMFPNSDFYYDKNGLYQKKYLEKESKIINEKFPFKYSKPVNKKTVLVINLTYYVYAHQVYDPWDKKLYTNVSDEQILKLKSGNRFVPYEKEPVKDYGQGFYILNSKFYFKGTEVNGVDALSFKYEDYSYKDKNHVYFGLPYGFFEIIPDADPQTYKSFTYGFYMDKTSLYYNAKKLISSNSIELLAIFWGRFNFHVPMDKGDKRYKGQQDFDSYLFKNEKGYWLITDVNKPTICYLGVKFDKKWNKAFADFELPREL